MAEDRIGQELEKYQAFSIRIVERSGFLRHWTFLAVPEPDSTEPLFERHLQAQSNLFRGRPTVQTSGAVSRTDGRPVAHEWASARCKEWMRKLIDRRDELGQGITLTARRPANIEDLARFEAQLTDDFDYVERRCQ